MKLLTIETSQDICSVALQNGEMQTALQANAPREHTERLLPMIEQLLDEAGLSLQQLDALAYGRGPGGFTGLRIASGVVQGLSLGTDLPVVPVSSLAAMAQGVYRQTGAERILCAFDARMQEVYWGAYVLKDGVMQLQGEEAVLSPGEVPISSSDGWVAAGSGWSAYADMTERFADLVSEYHTDAFPLALDMLPLAVHGFQAGQAVTAEQALPVYLRNKVAQTTAERTAERNAQ